MKKQTTILGILMAALICFGQDGGSVESIMNELESLPAQKTAEPVVSEPAESIPAESTPVETEQLADASMRLYAEGDYLNAAAGFEKVLRLKPDHALARYFQSRIDARVRRNTEEQAMEAVEQAWDGMILRNYPLSDETVEKLNLADAGQSVDVSYLFEPLPFEDGAYATYRPNLKKIMVFNTRETVQEMEALLLALETPVDDRTGQIEIETRFVEFAEGALEELGFEWSDAGDGAAQSLAGDWEIKDGETLFADALRTTGDSGVFDKPNALGMGTAAATGDWTAGRLTDHFGDKAGELRITGDIGENIDLLIRAIDQTSGVDVLSSPRVLTRSGEEALIQVGQRHYFPETFEAGASGGNIVHTDYQDFEEILTGVELAVTPRLVENDLIEMELNPKITELLGWRNYQIAPADSSYTYYQYRVGITFEHDPVIAKLPIFRRREVKTQVTIADGSTMGMGGLISEKTEHFSDRVPLLGSIPLIGRLFRSEGERTVKRNLMIFVTASRVAPSGHMVATRTFTN